MRHRISRRAGFALCAAAIAIGVGFAPVALAGALDHPVEQIPAQAAAETGMIDVGGARLAYWDTGGDGPAVILLHAASIAHDAWGYQQPVLAAAGYRVIAYARRGYKGSEAGPEDRGTASGDLHAVVEALGLEKVHLIGVAAGGIYAADYAATYPDRVASLVLANSLVSVGDADYMKASGALRPKGFEEMPADFKELGPSYRAGNPQGAAAWRELSDSAVHTRFRQGNQSPMTLDTLAQIAAPVLMLTGSADLYTPPPMLKRMADRIADVEIVVLDGVGHAAYWEQPGAFNDAVLGFLARNR